MRIPKNFLASLCIFMIAPSLQAQQWTYPAAGVTSFSGNVGIDRTAEYKLDIFTNSANNGIRLAHTGTGFTLFHSSSLTQSAWNGITQAGDAGIIFGTANETANFGYVIAPWMGATTGLRIDKNGNVGIGAYDTKGYRLAVNGDAIFTKVKVKPAGNWPDYVFHANYTLRPLSEVEQYIQQHHHLPEVPSAEEIAKNGLDIGDNQATLLKKIEELTLYVIEQNKNQQIQNQKLLELDRRVNVLQQENEQLKKQLDNTAKSKN